MIYPINVEVAVEYGIMSQHCSSTSHTSLCTVSDEPELFRYKSHVPWYCVRWTSTVPVQVTRSFVLCEINLHCSGTSHTFLCIVWDEPALFRYKSHVPLHCVTYATSIRVFFLYPFVWLSNIYFRRRIKLTVLFKVYLGIPSHQLPECFHEIEYEIYRTHFETTILTGRCDKIWDYLKQHCLYRLYYQNYKTVYSWIPC